MTADSAGLNSPASLEQSIDLTINGPASAKSGGGAQTVEKLPSRESLAEFCRLRAAK